MKTFYIDNLDKWLHQNAADIWDFSEGSLIDNYIVRTRRGYAAIIEKYATEWSSRHKVYFSRNEQDINKLYKIFKGDYITIQ